MSDAARSIAAPAARPAGIGLRVAVDGRFALLGGALVLVALASLLVGRYPAPGFVTPDRLASDPLAQRLVLDLRLPRILLAMLLGMSLGAAGAAFQQIFANPLVEPGFLGVSQGAAFGASAAIVLLGSNALLIQASAMGFALLGLALSYALAGRGRYGGSIMRLILAGIAVSAMFSAGVGALKYMSDPLSQLPEITFWLLGGLSGVTWAQFASVLPVVAISLFILFRMRWRLNLLCLDDATAYAMGARPGRERALALGAGVAATAAVVSVCGMVAWIGLVVPHVARRLFGSNSRFVLPGSLLLGGFFGVLCDDVARTALPGEIPIGILTSLVGSVFFVAILATYGRVEEHP